MDLNNRISRTSRKFYVNCNYCFCDNKAKKLNSGSLKQGRPFHYDKILKIDFTKSNNKKGEVFYELKSNTSFLGPYGTVDRQYNIYEIKSHRTS